jgi:COP9 signalosome complex subunit 3
LWFHGEEADTVQIGIVPRTANGQAIKTIRTASKAYEALAEAYEDLDNMAKLKSQIKMGAEIWAEV